jgi:hypothetical protein
VAKLQSKLMGGIIAADNRRLVHTRLGLARPAVHRLTQTALRQKRLTEEDLVRLEADVQPVKSAKDFRDYDCPDQPGAFKYP